MAKKYWEPPVRLTPKFALGDRVVCDFSGTSLSVLSGLNGVIFNCRQPYPGECLYYSLLLEDGTTLYPREDELEFVENVGAFPISELLVHENEQVRSEAHEILHHGSCYHPRDPSKIPPGTYLLPEGV